MRKTCASLSPITLCLIKLDFCFTVPYSTVPQLTKHVPQSAQQTRYVPHCPLKQCASMSKTCASLSPIAPYLNMKDMCLTVMSPIALRKNGEDMCITVPYGTVPH